MWSTATCKYEFRKESALKQCKCPPIKRKSKTINHYVEYVVNFPEVLVIATNRHNPSFASINHHGGDVSHGHYFQT